MKGFTRPYYQLFSFWIAPTTSTASVKRERRARQDWEGNRYNPEEEVGTFVPSDDSRIKE